jgi:hypothetical protein
MCSGRVGNTCSTGSIHITVWAKSSMIGPNISWCFRWFFFCVCKIKWKTNAKYSIIETYRVYFIALHYWFLVILFFFIFSIITCIEVPIPYHPRIYFVQDWIYIWKGILMRNTITFPFSIFVYFLHFSLCNNLVKNAGTPSIEAWIYVSKSLYLFF